MKLENLKRSSLEIEEFQIISRTTSKSCPKCGEIKDLSKFGKTNRTKSGFKSHCKACNCAIKKAQWAKMSIEQRRASRKNRTPEKQRGYHMKWAYGITPEIYQQMCASQNNKCKICPEPLPKNAHIDHCHSSKKVRGLLCNRCNKGLGMFRDNPEFLRNAASYVENSRED